MKDVVQDAFEQVTQARIGELGLGLRGTGGEHPVTTFHGGIHAGEPQGGLADASCTLDHQSGASGGDGLDEAPHLGEFGVPPEDLPMCLSHTAMSRSRVPIVGVPRSADVQVEARFLSDRSSTIDGMEAAFFDLDKTIISKSSSLALSRPMYRAGIVSRGQLLRGAYAQLVYLLVGADEKKMERLKDGMLALTRGWDRAEVEQLVHDVIIDVIDPFVYQEALDLIELHRQARRRIYIVSSSPEEVVRPLARHFGVSGVIATRAAIVDGKYTGELEFYAYGAQKAEAIRQLAGLAGVDLEGSYAYSDSITDLPMLEAVGHPVAVNPDKELRREAEVRGWDIRDFRRPVRLRSRIVTTAAQPRTQVAAGVMAAVAAAAILAWVVLRSRTSSRSADA